MRASWRPPSYLPLASPLSRAAALKPRGSRITSLCSSPSHIQFIPAIRSHLQQQQRLSSSSTRWKQRQGSDAFARSARVQGLKSRAAFKLLELDTRHRIFQPGQTVVDLGYAPGSWSQVALERTRARPGSGGSKRGRDGLVVGIDIIPAQPPRGVSTIQGNFLSPGVRDMVKRFVMEAHRRRQGEGILRVETEMAKEEEDGGTAETDAFPAGGGERYEDVEADGVVADRASHTDLERQVTSEFQGDDSVNGEAWEEDVGSGLATRNTDNERLVDVVLSDMSAPWAQTAGFSVNSLSNPYIRMMNTSGLAFRDHAGSMDLCAAALSFASDTLRPGGHFVCKFYQGSEDKLLEQRLKKLFAKVYREKPESSRSESKEAYFVALRRKADIILADVE